MPEMLINRDALVLTPDGEFGKVTHVIIAPETKEVTDLVVAHAGGETMVPIADVLSAKGDRVILRRHRAQYESANGFDRGDYHGVEEQDAREQSEQRALHGGGPLLSATDDAVEVGSALAQATERLDAGPRRLQLREEQLRIETRPEHVGTVSVGTRLVEHVETLTEPVREERVIVERLPGDGRVLIDGAELRGGESIDVMILKERVEVAKDMFVIEEVTVRKEIVEHEQQVEETLRKEELDIQETGNLVIAQPDGR